MTSSEADAITLPSGASVSETYNPFSDESFFKTFSENGRVLTFPDPGKEIRELKSSITTYVDQPKLFFTIGGIEYSFPLENNVWTVIRFDKPTIVTSVRIESSSWEHNDDAGHVGFDDGIQIPPVELIPVDEFPKYRALCISFDPSCHSGIREIALAGGFSLFTSEVLPLDYAVYDVIILTDINRNIWSIVPLIKPYVFAGGSVVLISGATYWAGMVDHEFLGYGSTGYVGSDAYVAVDNPLNASLKNGAPLKKVATGEHGAQSLYGVTGNVIASYDNGASYAFYTTYGAGKIYIQGDVNESMGGQEAKSNIDALFSAALKWLVDDSDIDDPELDEDRKEKNPIAAVVRKDTASPSAESEVTLTSSHNVPENTIDVITAPPKQTKLLKMSLEEEITLLDQAYHEAYNKSDILWSSSVIAIAVLPFYFVTYDMLQHATRKKDREVQENGFRTVRIRIEGKGSMIGGVRDLFRTIESL